MQSIIEVDCIVCGYSDGLLMLAHTEEIAYFGEHTQVTLSCPECGWRQTDFIPAESREPACISFEISNVEDLSIRVIRGSGCTIRLVELDLEVRPGSQSMGYVSNIEGVLNRFQDVIEMVGREVALEGDDSSMQGISEQMEKISQIRSGKFTATLEMLDPCGHSIILSENVKSRPLTLDELEDLPVGPAAGLMETGAAQSRSESQDEQ